MDDSRRHFEATVEPLLPRSAAFAHAQLGNRQDAEDAIQDAALRAYQRLGAYDPSRPFAGWWFAILRNCCHDILRRRQRMAACELHEVPQLDRPPLDEQDALDQALAGLSAAHREILQLRYCGDCSYRDLALALDIPEGTVMSRLHAARRALAERLAAAERDSGGTR